jgi:hypothetical protein
MEYSLNLINMQEDQLYQWWEYYAQTQSKLVSNKDELEIIKKGTLNRNCGPDYVAARFMLNGIIYQGDVEIHVHEEDWFKHKHHLDKAYRTVILHVFAYPAPDTRLNYIVNNEDLLRFCLPQPKASDSTYEPTRQCKSTEEYRKDLLFNLESLALHRFNLKVHYFLSELEYQNEKQVFYQNCLKVLGYPNNPKAFQLLAERLTWEWLVQNKKKILNEPDILYALYAGQAAFLPFKAFDAYTQKLKELYQSYQTSLYGQPLDNLQWQFAGSRPQNHPHFRLAGWVYLLHFCSYGIDTRLGKILSERHEIKQTVKEIHRVFKRPTNSYWSTHYALGKIRSGPNCNMFFGKARVFEFLINTVLPFYAAKTRLSRSEGYLSYLTAIFLQLPLVANYERIIHALPFANDCINNWPSQAVFQALIHLKQYFCDQSLCKDCPLQRKPG